MSNRFSNRLTVTSKDEKALATAEATLADHVHEELIVERQVFDKMLGIHEHVYYIITRRDPADDLFRELDSIEGVQLGATFTSETEDYDKRYQWNGDGYDLVEDGLTYPKSTGSRAKDVRAEVQGHLQASLVNHCELLADQIKQLPVNIAAGKKLHLVVLDAVEALCDLTDNCPGLEKSEDVFSDADIPF
jgi:hypothetical protein